MMYYSNDYLCHYGVLGMKWGQHIAARSQAKSAKRAAKTQRKADIAEGKKYQTYAGRSMAKAKTAVSTLVGVQAGGMGGAVIGGIAAKVGATSVSFATASAACGLGGVVLGATLATAMSVKNTRDMYGDIGAAARRGANYATDNMKYAKQVQDAADRYGIAARIKLAK